MTAVTLFLLIGAFFFIAKLVFSGPDLSQYDAPVGEHFEDHNDDREVTREFLNVSTALRQKIKESRSIKTSLRLVREFADNLSKDLQTDTIFTRAKDINGEWAVAAGADTAKRVLFLHGGGFVFGSAKGHRKFCDRLSKLSNAAVLSLDYRLLPKNKRGLSIKDAQQAYKWILNNGPDGPEPATFVTVAGDSAGGNLALMLANWSKREASRKPDAVIAFSPSTDMTLSSPTIKSNQSTDKMLGEGLGLLIKIPSPIRAWLGFIIMRINPANKLASPLFDDLSELPPTLIHASSSEMLLGDSIRFVNKARISGSEVKLQIWKNQIHDWHLFNMGHGSAEEAWGEVKKFIVCLEKQKSKPPVSA